METLFKTILVPTDFSESATSAAHYAAQLAKKTHAKIVLLHAYYVPDLVTDVTFMMPSAADLEVTYKNTLKHLKADIHATYGKEITVEMVTVKGGPVEEIEQYMKDHRVDLLVMGMKGASYLDERLFGSAVTKIMHLATCPVVVIEKDIIFQPIKKIVFACDYARVQHLHDQLKPLVRLAELFKAHVLILNVTPHEHSITSVDEAIAGVHLDHVLANVAHTFHQIEHADVVAGISAFAHERKADMVVMMPRNHSLLERLFSEPNTKQMAFHAELPLLTIHEEIV
jgi:nucleotide-binding universal stress UspA family protein